jgi:hypothetical protein
MAAEDPYHGVAAHNIPASASAPSLASYSKRAAVAKKLEKHRRPLLCLLATGAVVALYSLALWMVRARASPSLLLSAIRCRCSCVFSGALASCVAAFWVWS